MEYRPRYTTVHKSVNEVPTIAGVEKRLAIINWTIIVAMAFHYRSMVIVVIGVAIHSVLRYLTKKDPLVVPIYMRRNRQCDRYDPWPHATQKRGHRPRGYGRGNLC